MMIESITRNRNPSVERVRIIMTMVILILLGKTTDNEKNAHNNYNQGNSSIQKKTVVIVLGFNGV